LASQAAEGAGEDDAVVILVERAAAQLVGAVHGFAEPFAGEQCLPIQGLSSPVVSWRSARLLLPSFGVRDGACKGGGLLCPAPCRLGQPGGIDVEQQQAPAAVDELAGGHAVLVAGGVAVGARQGQPALLPALGQQLVEVGPPGPVVAQVAGVLAPALTVPLQVGGELGAVAVALVDAQ